MNAAAPRRRRRWWWLLVFASIFGIASWWINRQLEPYRLTARVLSQAGAALSLNLTIDGKPSYTLRPEPSLRLPNLKVMLPGESAPLLSATLLQVSLPWSTLLDGGNPLVITRVEIDEPTLDLRLLRRWQASQPETPFELPTLSEGLRIREGTVLDDAWTLQQWSLDLPTLTPEQPATAVTRGRWQGENDRVDFDGKITLENAGRTSDITLQLAGDWQRGEQILPYRIEIVGHYALSDAGIAVTASSLSLDSESPLPDFTGKASLTVDAALAVDIEGELAAWPETWPTLPAPIGQSQSPVQISTRYRGPQDLSGISDIALHRDDSEAKAQLSWPALQAWMDAPGDGLPPLQFIASSPRIELDGVVLEGVRVQLRETPAEPSEK